MIRLSCSAPRLAVSWTRSTSSTRWPWATSRTSTRPRTRSASSSTLGPGRYLRFEPFCSAKPSATSVPTSRCAVPGVTPRARPSSDTPASRWSTRYSSARRALVAELSMILKLDHGHGADERGGRTGDLERQAHQEKAVDAVGREALEVRVLEQMDAVPAQEVVVHGVGVGRAGGRDLLEGRGVGAHQDGVALLAQPAGGTEIRPRTRVRVELWAVVPVAHQPGADEDRRARGDRRALGLLDGGELVVGDRVAAGQLVHAAVGGDVEQRRGQEDRGDRGGVATARAEVAELVLGRVAAEPTVAAAGDVAQRVDVGADVHARDHQLAEEAQVLGVAVLDELDVALHARAVRGAVAGQQIGGMAVPLRHADVAARVEVVDVAVFDAAQRGDDVRRRELAERAHLVVADLTLVHGCLPHR